MIRGAAILLTIAAIFAASPHRAPETLRFGGGGIAAATKPLGADAALATAILRGALPEAAGKLASEGATRPVRQVGP